MASDLASRFGKAAVAAAVAAPRAQGGGRACKYDGIQPARQRLPQLPPGTYELRWAVAQPYRLGGGVKITFEVVEVADGGQGVAAGVDASVHAGSVVQVIQATANDTGLSQVVSMVMAFAGYEDGPSFFAEHDGRFIEDCSEGVSEALVGRRAYVQVTRGKDAQGGDYFRNYVWAPAEEPI